MKKGNRQGQPPSLVKTFLIHDGPIIWPKTVPRKSHTVGCTSLLLLLLLTLKLNIYELRDMLTSNHLVFEQCVQLGSHGDAENEIKKFY